MITNYKSDSSFFTYVKIPMSWIGIGEIRYWFQMLGGNVSKYRIIVDEDLDEERLDLKRREEYYPGTRVMTVVMNPWARIRLGYSDLKKSGDPRGDINFTDFVKNLPNLKDKKFDHWWHPLDQQMRWIEYQQEDGTMRKADYIFHVEKLDEEFQVIQDYFDCYEPLQWWTPLPKYKEFYTEETKAIVADLFAEDIERLGYTFEN